MGSSLPSKPLTERLREQDKEATVYIGNLDERITDALIWELMLQAGRIQNVHLPKDRVTQLHQGFGFVEFVSEEDADYAARIMNGIRLYGKPIRVNKASSSGQQSASANVGAELFIGNLDGLVDEKLLYDTFSRFGTLVNVPKVARDEHGISKGYGFVSYADFESSDAAIEHMNGQFMINKEISVQYAYKKDGKGERHGDEAERLLAKQAKAHGVAPQVQALPQALFQVQPSPAIPSAPSAMLAGDMGHGPPGGPRGMGVPGAPSAPAGFGAPPAPAGFAPPAAPAGFGGPPPHAPRAPAGLPPPPQGLPARPPSGAPPQNFYPPPGGVPPPGFMSGPPGFPPPAGFAPPPPGFAPPPGFGAPQQPPPGFRR